MGVRWVLGMDGGGTKTEAALVGVEGQPVSLGRGGPCNVNFVPEQRARESFREAIRGALSGAGGGGDLRLEAVGVGAPCPPSVWRPVLEELIPGVPAWPVGEVQPLISLAGARPPLLVVIAGTGALAYAERQGCTAHADALGALLGDEGSAYDLGHAALRRVARALDGRGRATALTPAVLARTGADDLRGLVSWAYGREDARGRVAALAETVDEVAAQGDPVARAILVCGAARLFRTALAAARRCGLQEGTSLQVILAGGVLRGSRVVRERLERELWRRFPMARVHTVRAPAALGCALLALQRARVGNAEAARTRLLPRPEWKTFVR